LNFADDWEGPGPDGNFEEDGPGGPVNLNLVSPNNVKEWLVTSVFFRQITKYTFQIHCFNKFFCFEIIG
jgi:hypothetical protein